MIRKILLFIITIFLIKGIIFIPPLWAASPLLQLQTDSSSVEKGEEFEVKIYLNTFNQPTVGVDAILNFDPSFLKVKRIDEGSIYPNYPAKIYQNETGVIKIAGSANYNQYFSGQGILAKILFEAKRETATTTIDFLWRPGATNETNVVSPQKKDLLTNEPEAIEIKIKAGSEAQVSPLPVSPSPSPAQPLAAGLVEAQSTSVKPSLGQRFDEFVEKIEERVSPERDKFVSPLKEYPGQVLGTQQKPSSKIPWVLLSGFLLLATVSLAIFAFRNSFFNSKTHR